MFGIDASTLILIESVAWARLMEFDHERFHIVEFEVRLAFGACVDSGEDGRVVEVDVSVWTMFLVGSDPRFVPFPSSDVSFMLCHPRLGFSRRFPDVGVVGIVFAIAIELINELAWRKFSLVFAAEDVLKASARFKDDRESSFVENAT